MATGLEPNKTKIAKRVFEIFEFFCDSHQNATVMDIVRRYGRPQSSTSELLSSLVEMGLLYKDPRSRSYSPTPRLAALGASAQPEIIRHGGLFTLMDQLVSATGCSVALFGIVGVHVQVFRLAPGCDSVTNKITYGAAEKLSRSVAGLLLLSTYAPDQADRTLWRLYAEAPEDQKFNLIEAKARLLECRRQRCTIGDAGFVANVQLAATLLPRSYIRRPLALGVILTEEAAVEAEGYIKLMNKGLAACAAAPERRNWQPGRDACKVAV